MLLATVLMRQCAAADAATAALMRQCCRCCCPCAAAAAKIHANLSLKIMIFGREIFKCEMCCFVMTNEKRQKTRNTYYDTIFITSEIHVRLYK
jgi:hypothetical protein